MSKVEEQEFAFPPIIERDAQSLLPKDEWTWISYSHLFNLMQTRKKEEEEDE